MVDGLEVFRPRKIPELSLSETFDIPIFINCRDRLGCLQQLVGWLLAAGYHQIFLIDNASTYPPLLSYYEEIMQDGRVIVIRLSRNFGHRAIWQARLLQQLNITTPYVYTDPDVLPTEDCTKGIVARLYQILRRYPFLEKVGVWLKTDDLPPHQQQVQGARGRTARRGAGGGQGWGAAWARGCGGLLCRTCRQQLDIFKAGQEFQMK